MTTPILMYHSIGETVPRGFQLGGASGAVAGTGAVSRGWLRHARIAVPTDATADRIVLESDHNKELLAYATSALSQGALRIRNGWDCVPHGSPKSF